MSDTPAFPEIEIESPEVISLNESARETTVVREVVQTPAWQRNAVHKAAMGISLLFLLAGLVAGGHWLRQRLMHVEENDARVEGEVVTIASRVDGWLLTRPVMEGDRVHKGQVLGELDTRDAQLRLKTLEGSVAAHNAQVHATTIQHDTLQKTSDAQIANARAQLAAVEAAAAVVEPQVEIARNDFARADSLVKTGATSRPPPRPTCRPSAALRRFRSSCSSWSCSRRWPRCRASASPRWTRWNKR